MPGGILAFIVGLPVVVFIAVPIGAMLLASFKVTAPLSPQGLAEATDAALAHLDGDIDARLDAWWEDADDSERVATFAAAFQILEVEPPWDRSARFAVQLERAQAGIDDLAPDVRARLERSLPLVHASQAKRAVIAAGVRDELPAPALQRLLSGETWRFGLDNYVAPLVESRLRRAGFNSLLLATTSATLVTVIAFGLAFGVHRRAVPGGDLVRGLVLAPLVSPPVIIALATLLLFGR
jgi:iron(III) transport system permease protein